VSRPDVPPPGTVADSTLGVTLAMGACIRLKRSRLSVGRTSKFVPFTVTAVPAVPMAGLKSEIVGVPLVPVTVKGELLVDDPPAVVTLMGPVVAPAGTLTVSCVAVAALTVACVPLKRTVFWLAVALKPTPEMVTVVPTGPCPGLKSTIRTAVAA
jgi:hypothetical protein